MDKCWIGILQKANTRNGNDPETLIKTPGTPLPPHSLTQSSLLHHTKDQVNFPRATFIAHHFYTQYLIIPIPFRRKLSNILTQSLYTFWRHLSRYRIPRRNRFYCGSFSTLWPSTQPWRTTTVYTLWSSSSTTTALTFNINHYVWHPSNIWTLPRKARRLWWFIKQSKHLDGLSSSPPHHQQFALWYGSKEDHICHFLYEGRLHQDLGFHCYQTCISKQPSQFQYLERLPHRLQYILHPCGCQKSSHHLAHYHHC